MPEKTIETETETKPRRRRRSPKEMPERRETWSVSIDEDIHRYLGILADRKDMSRKEVVANLVLDEVKFMGIA
jgi:hypothetical protein